MNGSKHKLTLDQPAAYQIKVPGHIDESWSDWDGHMTVMTEVEACGRPVTTLTGIVDQAALQGILRRLYALGLPLIAVNWVEGELIAADQEIQSDTICICAYPSTASATKSISSRTSSETLATPGTDGICRS